MKLKVLYKIFTTNNVSNMNYYEDINPEDLSLSTSFDFFILGLIIGAVLVVYLLRNNTN